MQEADWGKHSQAPWRAGGTATDLNNPKKQKAKPHTKTSTTEPVHISSSDKKSMRAAARLQAAVATADLNFKLLRWTFASSWGSTRADEPPLSPRTRPEAIQKQSEKNISHQDGPARLRVDTAAKSTQPFDRHLTSQYLDRCIAAVESQLAEGRNESKKRDAVKKIERLVEQLMTEADLVSEGNGEGD